MIISEPGSSPRRLLSVRFLVCIYFFDLLFRSALLILPNLLFNRRTTFIAHKHDVKTGANQIILDMPKKR